MNRLKRGIVLISLLSMVFALAGCQPAAKEEAKAEPVA